MGLLDRGSIGRYHGDMGGKSGSRAAKEAAALQVRGYEDASDEYGKGYDGAIARFDPYSSGGKAAMQRMIDGSTAEGYGASLETLSNSPMIQQMIQRKMKGIGNALNAGGLSRSGYGVSEMGEVTPEELMRIEGDLYGRNANVAGIGMSASGAQSGLDVDKTNALAKMILAKSGAKASGVLGSAAAKVAGSQNRYNAMHNAGTAVMGMFSPGGGGGGGTSDGAGSVNTVNQNQGESNFGGWNENNYFNSAPEGSMRY